MSKSNFKPIVKNVSWPIQDLAAVALKISKDTGEPLCDVVQRLAPPHLRGKVLDICEDTVIDNK